jgi:hypothetical protein
MRVGGGTRVAAVILLAAGAAAAMAQGPAVTPTAEGGAAARRQVSFSFDRKGVQVSHYRLTVYDNATGVYEGDEVPNVSGYTMAVAQPAQPFKHVIAISPVTLGKVFSTAERLKRFDVPCATKLKNIADTGTKTLAYQGPDGQGSCTYNYSENKDVQGLTDIFQGIAETLDTGRKLDQLHRYDRLGLDSAMKSLAEEVSAGHALEIGTIATSLRSIASDTDVMARVRSRATALLNQSSTDPATP